MSENVTPVATSALKRWSKRAVITTLVVGAVALIAAKLQNSDDETDTPQA